MLRTILFFSLILTFFLDIYAQDRPVIPSGNEGMDSIRQEETGLFNESNKNTFRVLFSGNPGKAALYSLIVPGAGQLYNRRYWKIPIVYAGLGAVSYLLYEANDSYQDEKQYYIDNIGTSIGNAQYNVYIAAKQSREQAIFAVIGVHLFNVFDAYIDRHLIDFDLDEDLSFELRALPDGISPIGLSLCINLEERRSKKTPVSYSF